MITDTCIVANPTRKGNSAPATLSYTIKLPTKLFEIRETFVPLLSDFVAAEQNDGDNSNDSND